MTHVHVCAWRWEKHREDFKAQGFNKKKKQTKGAWKGLSYTVYEITELKACHVFITLVKWHRRNRKMVINKADIGWCQCSPGASMSPWYADPILNYASHKVEKINNVWLMRHLTGKKNWPECWFEHVIHSCFVLFFSSLLFCNSFCHMFLRRLLVSWAGYFLISLFGNYKWPLFSISNWLLDIFIDVVSMTRIICILRVVWLLPLSIT